MYGGASPDLLQKCQEILHNKPECKQRQDAGFVGLSSCIVSYISSPLFLAGFLRFDAELARATASVWFQFPPMRSTYVYVTPSCVFSNDDGSNRRRTWAISPTSVVPSGLRLEGFDRRQNVPGEPPYVFISSENEN